MTTWVALPLFQPFGFKLRARTPFCGHLSPVCDAQDVFFRNHSLPHSAGCGKKAFIIRAARKNVGSSNPQAPKSREVAVPRKIGVVGVPVKSSPALEGKFGKGGDQTIQELREDQAVGQVVAAQANFVKVVVDKLVGNRNVENLPRAATQLEAHETDSIVKPMMVARCALDGAHKNEILSTVPGHVDSKTRTGAVSSRKNEALQEDLILLCVVRGLLKKINRRVLVGDRVVVSGIDWQDKRGMIEDVFDRISEVSDPPVANVNHLLVVFSMDRPKLDPTVLSRFLVEVESTDIPFTLVLNKADLVSAQIITEWQHKLADWGYTPFTCSANRRKGISALAALLKDRVSVILGPSGVGKSSLVNVLRIWNGGTMWHLSKGAEHWPLYSADEVYRDMEIFKDLRVGEVSLSTGRGRHTTRHVSLVRLPEGGGLLADSPGFSQPHLARVSSSLLAQLYPEVRKRVSKLGSCGFPNCLHVGEPSCAVGADWERYPHYLALLEEVRNRERVEKRVLGTKRESEIRFKSGTEGIKQAEPRLVMKKHRRTSRKHLKQSLEEELRVEEQLHAEFDQ